MLIIKGKYLISTVDDIYTDHALVVEGDKVVDLIPNSQVEDYEGKAQIIDKTDSVIMPAFMNAHMHQYGVLSRGIPANVEFKDFEGFLWDYWWPFIEDRIGLKEVKITSKASAIELIESGVVAFCDTLEAPSTEEGTLIEQAKIIDEIGMKAVLSLESSERVDWDNGVKCLEENENLIKWTRINSKNVSGIMCTHTTFTCSEKFLKLAQAKAEVLDAPWQFHLSESIYEVNHSLKHNEKRPANYLNDLGLLDERVLASQCVKVDEEEIAILKDRGVKVVHMPLSNCEVGGGFAPIPDLLDAGVNVGLGTDGYINDFFEVLRAAFLIHKASKEDASVMPAKKVFQMATEYGAEIIGLENSGRLLKGNQADFIILEDQFKTPLTLNNIFDQIVVQGQKEFVHSVYCDGKALLKDKELTNLDKEAISKEMRQVADEFWQF